MRQASRTLLSPQQAHDEWGCFGLGERFGEMLKDLCTRPVVMMTPTIQVRWILPDLAFDG